MSYAFSRDRTAELRDSFEGTQRTNEPPRTPPTGYNRNPFPQEQPRQTTRYNSDAKVDAYEMQPPSDIQTMDGFFDEIEKLKEQVHMINENIDEIERIHNSA